MRPSLTALAALPDDGLALFKSQGLARSALRPLGRFDQVGDVARDLVAPLRELDDPAQSPEDAPDRAGRVSLGEPCQEVVDVVGVEPLEPGLAQARDDVVLDVAADAFERLVVLLVLRQAALDEVAAGFLDGVLVPQLDAVGEVLFEFLEAVADFPLGAAPHLRPVAAPVGLVT
ncbi:hypothetical protein L0U85_04920 [Glycomyces sp. L485]|uniref:hypothetical protein n=1 Tax=Glycomyces sp. L485 TaxID=2909235 RepID=UPI001F4A8DE9|nr:hypothetical protein [Glycomyces sp. L485]MCH7230206.1 hypothetical protein [Glycomyces sp. L485]